jgi:hypothetical protein
MGQPESTQAMIAAAASDAAIPVSDPVGLLPSFRPA